MTETQVNESVAVETPAESDGDLVTTSIVDGVVTFTVNGSGSALNVAMLPQSTLVTLACEQVRNLGRSAIQKMSDPAKIVTALHERFDRIERGDFSSRRGREKQPDDLTRALMVALDSDQAAVELWIENYYNSPSSGCNIVTRKDGKVMLYGKDNALDKLRRNPKVAAELKRIAAERNKGKKNDYVDLDSLAL